MILLKIFRQFTNKNKRKRVKEHFRRVCEVLRYRYFFNPMSIDMGDGTHINPPALIFGKENIHLGKNCNIDWESRLYCTAGQFIMKDNSGAAVGLTVITSNHDKKPGVKYNKGDNSNLVASTVLVEEQVWIAANVTLLPGAHIGRGAIIGAGAVVRNIKVPPYAIVVGNPAKIVGFRYTPEEIIMHEKVFYPEGERLSLEILQKNEYKYVTSRAKELMKLMKV